ncbi:metallophosphoesterase [Thermococcus paralvinellae]|uniref:Metallophosphoesterase n=1 Tax=Thermococcus paralvinellae TaxID=582419 RepID=W0I3L1_9EURY|nr:metallophosphoesterase [Thermococcus paralvinellae]AHF80624.1 metallophosphoesterase [Thermococcus paralvinellae]
MKKALSLLLVFIIFSLVPTVPAKAETLYPLDVLAYPAPGAPIVAIPGETVTMRAQDGVEITSLSIVSVLNGPYELQIVGKNGNELQVKIPENVVPDDYFLIVKSNKGEVVIPNGVWILKEYPKVLRIAHGSDLHVTSGAKIGYVNGEKFCRSIFKCGEGAIPLSSYMATDSFFTYWGMNPAVDVIIATGDVVDTAGDSKAYGYLLSLMENAIAAGKPTIIVKGNHDDPPKYFSKLIAPPIYYITIGKFIIIALDSDNERSHPTMEQLEWMEKILEQNPDKIPIIIVHHPYWYKTPEGRSGKIEGLSVFDDWETIAPLVSWYWIGGPERKSEDIAKRFLEDVEKYNIKLVLSGHVHADYVQVYIDKKGNEHWFVTSTTTGAPDKREKDNWYGSRIVEIDENGNVRLPGIEEMFGTIFGPISSFPVPQEFIVFRHTTDFGSAIKFVNEYQETTGKIAVVVPEGAKVDDAVTNVKYKVLGERTIGDKHYMLLEVTVPKGVSELVITKGKDTEKPQVSIAYTSPSKPIKGKPFKVYFKAKDNLGIKDLYVEIEANGEVKKYPAEPTKGGPNVDYFLAQIPGVDADEYTIRVVAVDFYGNKAVAEKVMGKTTTTTTSKTTTTTTSETTPSESSPAQTSTATTSKTCGPAVIVGLALVPLLIRRKK